MFILINMPYFSEEINGKMKTVCKFRCGEGAQSIIVITDNNDGEEKEEDSRLPLTLGENYSALAAMT